MAKLGRACECSSIGAYDPLVVTNADGSKRSTAVQNQLWFNVGASINLLRRVQLSLNVPLAAYQNGFGDLGLTADLNR